MHRTALILALTMVSWTTSVGQTQDPQATPIEAMRVKPGFEVELLYSVPKEQQGSWVNMCVDPRGRLIVSDQYGALYRVTPPPVGTTDPIEIEEIKLSIGAAQGLLWAFDSLYVMVNARTEEFAAGLYRLRDTDGDDQLDTVEHLRELEGRGEHGPHAVLLAPDGESLYVVCGDSTPLTEFASSRVPEVWDEDLLLPRPYGRGFMKGVRAPGGYIARIDPAGKDWELVAVGFRNQYDAALNRDGELFTFDADMEWDMNTPWYRPTRICHVVSGAEFGWRNGGGKWPAHYPDSVPAVVDIGPGSPTGICFGYGAKFPAKYEKALFVSDWSYGKLYAVHLEPRGATYSGTFEEFINGTPLPLTDVVINPHDGSMYFAIGGRRVQSGLYRVRYVGDEEVKPGAIDSSNQERLARRQLESLHAGDHPEAVEVAWPYLRSADRSLRYAARVALEHRPLAEWQDRALSEPYPQGRLTALLAMVRKFERVNRGEEPEIDSLPPVWEQGPAAKGSRGETLSAVLRSLDELGWEQLSVEQRVGLLRVYELAFLRLGAPTESQRSQLIDKFAAVCPNGTWEVDSALAQLLVYLQSTSAAEKVVALLEQAATQEEQIDYAKTLRHLRVGWTPELRARYLKWFPKANGYRGGASFSLFVKSIQDAALEHATPAEREDFEALMAAQAGSDGANAATIQRPFVREWQLDELVPMVANELKNRNFEHGRDMFAAANCFGCHRFDNQGGAIGPDLTSLSGRFSQRDLLESIVEPNREISDQYAAVTIITDDGRTVTGRIVNLNGNTLNINTNMLDPNAQTRIERDKIEEMLPSKVSMMPTGLLNTLNKEDVLDLMAYLLSRGDPNHDMFSH